MQEMDIRNMAEMTESVERLNRMSIAQLKDLIKKLTKSKDKVDRDAIKIIKTIIDHKKGKIDLSESWV